MKHLSTPQNDDYPLEKKKGTLLFFLYQTFVAHKGLLITLLLVTIAYGCGEALLPYGMMKLVDKVVLFYGSESKPLDQLYMNILGFVIFLGFCEVLNRFSKYLQLRFYRSLKTKLRYSIFNFMDNQDIETLKKTTSTKLSRIVNESSKHVENIFRIFFDSLLPVLATLTCVALILSHLHYIFPLIFCGWFFIMLLATLNFSKKISVLSTQQAHKEDTFFKTLHDIFLNLRANKFFGTPLKVFNKNLINESQSAYLRDVLLWRLDIVRSLISIIAVGITWFLILKFLNAHLISIGEFGFALFMSLTMIKLSWWCSEQIILMRKDLGFLSFVDRELNALKFAEPPKYKFPERVKGRMHFESVSFGYGNKDNDIIDNVNFKIAPGEFVGITGASGSGKSTVLDLLTGILNPRSGRVIWDDIDISQMSQKELLKFVSFMPQESVLYNQTILQNLCHEQIELNSKVRKITELTRCNSFIEKLPEGYQTQIQDQGKNLSLGQRRRILLARALLKEAPILIMDEPTSSLDQETEFQIFNDIFPFIRRCTVIMTTHRKQILSNVDRVIEIKGAKYTSKKWKSEKYG